MIIVFVFKCLLGSLVYFFFFFSIRAYSCHKIFKLIFEHSVSSVAQSCPTLCDSMDCSTPGLPVWFLYYQKFLGMSSICCVHWRPLSHCSKSTFVLCDFTCEHPSFSGNDFHGSCKHSVSSWPLGTHYFWTIYKIFLASSFCLRR